VTKKTKSTTTVFSFLIKVGQIGKIGMGGMLNNQNTIGLQHLVFED